jgi:hypothetical protein
MGPTIANSACTTLASSDSNKLVSFVGTLTNHKICSFVPNFGLLKFTERERSDCTQESGTLIFSSGPSALLRAVASLLFCTLMPFFEEAFSHSLGGDGVGGSYRESFV